MTDDPKQRALERLLAMVDKACDVVDGSLSNAKVRRGQQTRSADAWRVLDVVLKGERSDDDEGATPGAEGVTPADDLASRRQALQAALRAKRADKQ